MVFVSQGGPNLVDVVLHGTRFHTMFCILSKVYQQEKNAYMCS